MMFLSWICVFFVQKLDASQLRKIQSMDGGLGVPVSRNGFSSQQPKLSNGTSSTHGPPKLPGGPTLIEEPFKKLKKPSPQTQARSSTLAPSNNMARSEGDKRYGNEGRGLAASTSLKSLSDSSSADTSDSKVLAGQKPLTHTLTLPHSTPLIFLEDVCIPHSKPTVPLLKVNLLQCHKCSS